MYNGLFKKNNEISSYWLGLIFADGCIYQNRKKPNYFKFSLGFKMQDRYVLSKFLEDIGEPQRAITESKNDSYASISISNKELCHDLLNLGVIPRKSRKLTGNEIIHSYLSDFCRGYFDGDGSVGLYRVKGRNRPKPIFSIFGHKPFLLSMKQAICEQLKIYLSSAYNRESTKVFAISTGKRDSIIKLNDFLYTNAKIKFERKYERFQQILDYFSKYKLGERVNRKCDYYIGNRGYMYENCLNCQKEFGRRSDSKTIYCSKSCYFQHKREKNICH